MRCFRVIVITVAVIGMMAIGCGRKEAPKPKEAKAPEQASQPGDDNVKHKVLSFNLEGLNEKGAKKWDVNGESAEAISENEVKLDNIVAKAYGEEAQAVITADQGVYNRSKNNVRLEKNVKATIEATQGFANDFVSGSGQATSKPAEGAGQDKKKKSKTVITCDGEVQFDYEKNQAYFLKNVHVVSEDGIIDADKITVYLEPDSRRLTKIVAEGNVKITQGENVTYSEKASYVESEKKVTLSGKPKLVISGEGAGLEANFLGEARK